MLSVGMPNRDQDRRQTRRRVARHASPADLPRLPRPLAIGLKTPVGKVVGQVRWIDTFELLLLTPGRVAEAGEIPARIALSTTDFADVTLRVLQVEDPWSTAGGVLQVARWMPKDDETLARLEAFMRSTNAIVFGIDYAHPRSTNERQLAATEAKKKEIEREALAALRGRHSGELAESTSRHASVVRRNRAFTLGAGLSGLLLGAVLGLLGDDFRLLRVLLWRVDPARAIELGVLEGATLAGEDFSGAKIDLVKFRESRLVGASFRGASLDHADFTGADLRRADLREAKLTDSVIVNSALAGARFAGADLRGAAIRADLAAADLRGALFDGTTSWPSPEPAFGAFGPSARAAGASVEDVVADGWDLTGANFEGAELHRVSLKGARLDAARLGGALLVGVNFREASLTRADLRRATLREAHLDGANLSDAQLDAADLAGASLTGARLARARAAGVNLTGSALGSADLSQADLRGARLVGADLRAAGLLDALLLGADLTGARLDGARLAGAVVDTRTKLPEGAHRAALGLRVLGPGAALPSLVLPENSDLVDQDLAGATLLGLRAPAAAMRGVNLSAANLNGADLQRADLSGASLDRTQLQSANLVDARLVSANLSGANLSGANLAGADLSAARLAGAKFTGARANAATRWPGGRAPVGIQAVP